MSSKFLFSIGTINEKTFCIITFRKKFNLKNLSYDFRTIKKYVCRAE